MKVGMKMLSFSEGISWLAQYLSFLKTSIPSFSIPPHESASQEQNWRMESWIRTCYSRSIKSQIHTLAPKSTHQYDSEVWFCVILCCVWEKSPYTSNLNGLTCIYLPRCHAMVHCDDEHGALKAEAAWSCSINFYISTRGLLTKCRAHVRFLAAAMARILRGQRPHLLVKRSSINSSLWIFRWHGLHVVFSPHPWHGCSSPFLSLMCVCWFYSPASLHAPY